MFLSLLCLKCKLFTKKVCFSIGIQRFENQDNLRNGVCVFVAWGCRRREVSGRFGMTSTKPRGRILCRQRPPGYATSLTYLQWYIGSRPTGELWAFTFRAQWLRGRTSDSQLREPGFVSCAVVLKPWASFFTLHCSSSLSCNHEYLTIYSGGYVYEQPSRIICSIQLVASQRSRDGV